MTNTALLEGAIAMSGIKKSMICSALHCTYATFRRKVIGKSDFTATEMYVLCDLLSISGSMARQIFFADEREFNSQNGQHNES